MYERILVPTDGSEGTAAAVEHAVEIGAERDATIHGLYVVDKQIRLATSKENQAEVAADLRAEGERAVGAIADAAAEAGLESVTETVEGVPHRAILDYIEDADVDLVVMGTHGRTGRDRIVSLGSVTERVVGNATVPVLTVWIGDD
jgi:nucleotide-binding universal stress UspA family protein